MWIRTYFAAAICLACWLIIAGFPVSGYNSLNESAEAALPLNITALESDQANLSQVADEILKNLTNMEPSMSGSVDYSNTNANCLSHLSIVDYWGNHYPSNNKYVFLNDIVRMIVAPCKTGLLKLYERNPDGSEQSSNYIRVFANRKYNWWFIGDTVGQHTLWFTIQKNRYGCVSPSNDVEYRVISETCPDLANCSPTPRYA